MKSALMVIDVQESFRRRPNWVEVSNPYIADDVSQLVERAREGGHEVIWVLHSEPGSETPFDPDLGQAKLQPGLEPRKGEPVLTKTSRNAFTTTRLDQILTVRGVRRLLITGIQTEQCCETTARLAADLGYEVDFVTEATATFPIVRPDTGARLECDEIIERTEAALAGRFARIVGIEGAFAEEPVAIPAS